MESRSTDDEGAAGRRRVVRIRAESDDLRALARDVREVARGARDEGRRVARALADPIRLQIFEQLADGERTVKDLAEGLHVAPDRLYYHLNLLQDADIVRIAEFRPERVYALCQDQHASSPQDVADLIGTVLDATTSELRQVLRLGAEARSHGSRAEKLQAAVARTSVELAPDEFEELMEQATELVNSALERAQGAGGADRKKKAGKRRQFRIVFAAYETPRTDEGVT